jgi:transposase
MSSTASSDPIISENEALRAENVHLRTENLRLSHRLEWAMEKLFGRSSERRASIDLETGQTGLFEGLAEASREISAPESPTKTNVSGHTRALKGALSRVSGEEDNAPEGTFPSHLRREEIVIDTLPEGADPDDYQKIAEKVTERLASRPSERYVKRFVRSVYKKKESGEILPAPAPEHVFDRSKADETLLIEIVIAKFLWHQPLYRQEQKLRMEGIHLSRATLVGWVIKLGLLLQVVAEAVREEVEEEDVVHVDETPITIGSRRNESGKRTFDQGYLWPIVAANVGIFFAVTHRRNNEEAFKILERLKKTSVSDAYRAYETFAKTGQLRWQLCWMHIRRNFIDAETSNPTKAAEALSFIRRLYDVERKIKEKDLKKEKILEVRTSQSVPILEEFMGWLKRTAAEPEAITSAPLSKAISYVLKRWDAACLFVKDGSVPIDNGAAERGIRPVKLGAKNWLFATSELGADALAVFYTLIGSCVMLGIHPYYYLLDLITKRLHQPGLTARDLTPRRWKERFEKEAIPEFLRKPNDSS